MDDESIICPACGSVVPEGQYCKDCGSSLSSSQDVEIVETVEQVKPDTPEPELEIEVEEEIPYPQFSFRIEEIDELSHAILFSRAELEVLDLELDKLIEQISATRQAAHLEQADKTLILERVKILRNTLEETKSRKSELLAFKRHLRLEEIHSAQKSYLMKESKLKDTKSSLDSEVYEEQRKEIEKKLDIIKRDLKTAQKTVEKWFKGIRKTMKDLTKQLSRIEAKHKIDDISDKEYEKSRSILDRSIETLVRGKRILEEILEISKK